MNLHTEATAIDLVDAEPGIAAPRQPAPELGPRAQNTIARIVEATRAVCLTHG